jgi:hypothetical protein
MALAILPNRSDSPFPGASTAPFAAQIMLLATR